MEAFFLYSPNESAIMNGAGFWNKEKNMYVELDEANEFTEEEMQNFEMPSSTGDDIRFFPKKNFLGLEEAEK